MCGEEIKGNVRGEETGVQETARQWTKPVARWTRTLELTAHGSVTAGPVPLHHSYFYSDP